MGCWRSSMTLLTCLAVGSPVWAATLLPLATERADTIPSRTIEAVLGVSYLNHQRFPFFTSKGEVRDQDLVAAPQLALHFGIADWVEVQASYELLYLDEQLADGTDNQHYGSGDARLSTKVWLVTQGPWWPAAGVRFGTKLPNANFDDRLGTDEIDFEINALASHDFGLLSVHCNLGLGLYGNPGPAVASDHSFESGGQDDLFLWSLALAGRPLSVSQTLSLQPLLEVAGDLGSRFDNDRGVVRLGGQLGWGAWVFYLGSSAGLLPGSEHFGASGGLVYTWQWGD